MHLSLILRFLKCLSFHKVLTSFWNLAEWLILKCSFMEWDNLFSKQQQQQQQQRQALVYAN